MYRLLYINLLVATNQKSIIDTHTKKRKESKHNTKDRHQITREESKRKRKKQTNKKTTKKTHLKTVTKMTISTYLPIITLNVNGLNAVVKR